LQKSSTKKNKYSAFDSLKEIVETGSYFEPGWTQHLLKKKIGSTLKYDPRTLKACDELVETSYFLAGGAILKASIGLDTKYYPAVFRRFKKTIDKSYLRNEVFQKLLDFHGFDPKAISRLSVDSLKSIRKDSVTRKLRKVLDKTLEGSEKSGGNSLMKELSEAVASESKKAKTSKFLMRTTLIGLNLFHPVVNVSGDLLLEQLAERYPVVPIQLFCTRILPKEVARSSALEYL